MDGRESQGHSSGRFGHGNWMAAKNRAGFALKLLRLQFRRAWLCRQLPGRFRRGRFGFGSPGDLQYELRPVCGHLLGKSNGVRPRRGGGFSESHHCSPHSVQRQPVQRSGGLLSRQRSVCGQFLHHASEQRGRRHWCQWPADGRLYLRPAEQVCGPDLEPHPLLDNDE